MRGSRRAFLGWLASFAGGLLALLLTGGRAAGHGVTGRRALLRPPGALPDGEFQRLCIRCGRCVAVCPNTAILMAGVGEGLRNWNTPYLVARQQACMLCMKCTHACPTGALKAIPPDDDSVRTQVKMGRAVVDKSMCYSYQRRTCGVCIRACPFPAVAMKTGLFEQPIVTEACVGCGLCERACIHVPQAVRVIPRGA